MQLIYRKVWLIMRLTTLFILLAMVSAWASGSAQTVSFRGNDVPLQTVFDAVKEQTGYTFFYRSQDLRGARPVTLDLKDAPLLDVLDHVFERQRLAYNIQGKTVFVTRKSPSSAVSAGQRGIEGAETKNLVLAYPEVRGRVVDSLGNPLQGASIRVLNAEGKRTTLQTTTDHDGYFLLRNVPEEAQLEITYVGHVSQTVTADTDIGSIVLEAIPSELEEVEVMVNTGYQSLKANEINGSITYVGQETLEQSTDPNILNRLNGMVNGLTFQVGRSNRNPQNETQITIRGYSTINGPLDPLIVVDNFVYEGDIDNINANDVESVTILKDAEATSIYGARGGNGVIVITMKKGVAGTKIKVDADVNTRISAKPDLSKIPMMANADYMDVEKMLFDNGYFDRDFASASFTPITPYVDLLDQHKRGLITQEELDRGRRFYEETDLKSQYSDVFYHHAINSQYNLRLSGGNQLHTWTISGSHNRNQDQYKQKSDNSSLRLFSDVRINDWIQMQLGGSFSKRNGQTRPIDEFTSLLRVGSRQSVPYMSLFDKDGNELPFYQIHRSGYIDTVGGGLLKDWRYFPLSDVKYVNQNSVQELIGNISVNVKIVKGLDLGLYYQHQTQEGNTGTHYPKESFFIRDKVNKFAQIDYATGIVDYVFPDGDMMSKSVSNQKSYNFRSQLDLRRTFGDHAVVGMAGFEARQVTGEGESWNYYGYSEDPLGYLDIDLVNYYPVRPIGISGLGIGAYPEVSSVNRFVSVYANANYTYRGKYAISGNIRKDGSNIYGVSTNEKWKPLWSLGIGYLLFEEDFFDYDFVEHLRLKATWGYSGNVDLSKSALPVAVYGNNPVDLGGLPYAVISTVANPSLRWEQVRQINAGVDFALFDNKLNGSIEHYRKFGSDLYGLTDYDYTTFGSAGTVTKNVADMRGAGVDVQLRYRQELGKLTWTSSFIYNYSISKTVSYYDAVRNSSVLSRLIGNGTNITPYPGMHLYSIAAYKWAGLDGQGNPMGYLEGKPSTDYDAIISAARSDGAESGGIRFVGSAIPTHFGSLYNEFSLGDFSLSFNLTYKFGYFFKRAGLSYSSLVNYGIGRQPNFAERWQKEGDDTDVPSFIYPLSTANRENLYLGSEHLVERGDQLRLQFVNLNYNLNLNRFSIRRLQLFFNASNLGVLWTSNPDGLDPDNPYGIPPQRTYAFGFRFSY